MWVWYANTVKLARKLLTCQQAIGTIGLMDTLPLSLTIAGMFGVANLGFAFRRWLWKMRHQQERMNKALRNALEIQ